MWNLTPEYIQQVKEELNGRRAAVQARQAEELKQLEHDIEELEALERLAYAVAVKYLSGPASLTAEPEAAPEAIADLQAAALDDPIDSAADPKGQSRWRMRLDANSGSEPA
jgi:hypothetical protein